MMGIEQLYNGKATAVFANGGTVFFSYSTPVAVTVFGDNGGRFVTDKFFSVTTSRHVNKWTAGYAFLKVSQEKIEELAANI